MLYWSTDTIGSLAVYGNWLTHSMNSGAWESVLFRCMKASTPPHRMAGLYLGFLRASPSSRENSSVIESGLGLRTLELKERNLVDRGAKWTGIEFGNFAHQGRPGGKFRGKWEWGLQLCIELLKNLMEVSATEVCQGATSG